MENSKRIKRHFKNLDRKLFMEEYQEFSKMDRPFPIGYGQTISQPSLVLKMTQYLSPTNESRVLEIGTGSGFQTALLSEVSASVYTVEIIEELYFSAKKRLKNLGYTNVEFKLDDGHLGWSEFAPYDRIMVTACAKEIPEELIKQLKVNGKMIISVESDPAQDLLLVSKNADNEISKEFISKVRFVDLV